MSEYYEIDFLNVAAKRSGDAIPLRYEKDGQERVHVVDGGFQATGDSLVVHVREHYANPQYIDHVVVTHNDGDHAGGLRRLFDDFEIGTLWMLRPWLYAKELIHLFKHFTSVENLEKRLKDLYPNLVELENLANETGTPIEAPFQGAQIGAFFSLAPSRQRFFELIVESDRTPEVVQEYQAEAPAPTGLAGLFKAVTEFVAAKWGEENFSAEETSAENEMSVVQYAYIAEKRILLTGDAGRAGLNEAADYLTAAGVQLPGMDVFQVPHHGSRRNVSTAALDRLLGTRLLFSPNEPKFTAIVCASKEDEHHPRNAVVRACYHRGSGKYTHSTEEAGITVHKDSPYLHQRGWGTAPSLPYPENQEA